MSFKLRQCLRRLSTKRALNHPVSNAFRAIIEQQKALLGNMSDDEYIFKCPILQGTTGGHVRHSLDHLKRALAIGDSNLIRYDIRERNTLVEHDRSAALAEMDKILGDLDDRVDEAHLVVPVEAAFMLSSDGNEVKLHSTVEREMAFSVHHAIHHNALIKVIVATNFPHVSLPPLFGVAPSTIQYQNQLSQGSQ